LEDGTFVATLVPNGTAGLVLPGGIAVGPDGNLYIANIRMDANFQDIGSEILRFDPNTGEFLGRLVPAGLGLNVPFAMRFGRP
jgi:DNA-binding beta-propeller fold protein YncE